MKTFEAKKFDIPELKGISAKNIEEHLKLYQGYVTQSNKVLEKISELLRGGEENMGLVSGLQRRFGFEFNGMRNHEYYFSSFEGGPKNIDVDGMLYGKISEEWGLFDEWLRDFKMLASTRGVGWAILYYDQKSERLLNAWVDEQHLGHLVSCQPILALDMWEHSFVFDYQPSGKKNYIEDFFTNLNWEVIEENFKNAQ